MEFEPDIAKLEKVVSRLLAEYNVVKEKCEKLTLDLAESLARIDELKEEKTTLLNDNDTVHSRVSTILEKLSEWEGGLDSKNVDDVSEKAEIAKDSTGQLFSMGSSSQ